MANNFITLPLTGGGVTSINGKTGAITLAAGTGITISPSGNTLTIASTGLSKTLTNSHIFVGNASNQATDVAVTGGISISNTGAVAVNNVLGFVPDSAATPNTLVLRDSGGSFSVDDISFAGSKSIFGSPDIWDPTDTFVSISLTNSGLQRAGGNIAFDWNLNVDRDLSSFYTVDFENRSLVSTPSENYTLNWQRDDGIQISGFLSLTNSGRITSPVTGAISIYSFTTKTVSYWTGSNNADNDFSNLSRDRTYVWPDSDGTVALGGPFVPSAGGSMSGQLSIDPSADVVDFLLNKSSGFTTDLYRYSFNGLVLGGMRSDARTFWGAGSGSASISNLFVSRNNADAVISSRGGGAQSGPLFSAESSGGSSLSTISASGTFLAPNGTASLPGISFLSDTDTGIYRVTSNEIAIATVGAEVISFDQNGNIRAFSLHNNGTAQGTSSQQDIRSGTYTPTLTNTANISASTAFASQWMRVGNVVTVSGKVNVTGTITLTATQLGISLPVTSTLSAQEKLAGTAFCPTVAGNGAALLADTTNNRVLMQWTVSGVAADSYYYTFTYLVT